jgi:hypothetical protein
VKAGFADAVFEPSKAWASRTRHTRATQILIPRTAKLKTWGDTLSPGPRHLHDYIVAGGAKELKVTNVGAMCDLFGTDLVESNRF